MSQSSFDDNQQWKAQQRAEAKEHANRPTRGRGTVVVGRYTPGGMDTTRQGGVIYHANRRRELMEKYRGYGSTRLDADGLVRTPIQRRVKLSELHLEPELFDHRFRHEGTEVRQQTVNGLVDVLEREKGFDPLIDVMEFNGKLVVLDGHTRHHAYVQHFDNVNMERAGGRKKESLMVLEHFGGLPEALLIAKRENSKQRQQHSEKERKQIAWVMWRDDADVSQVDQSMGSGLSRRKVKAMRTIYNKMLSEFGWTRAELLTKDWAGVMHLYHNGPLQQLTDEEKDRKQKRDEIVAKASRAADDLATQALRQTFGPRPLKQPRRALQAIVRVYGSPWLQALAADDRREHPELEDQEGPEKGDF